MIDLQRSSPEWDGYGSLCKVYSAWIMLDPHADERNSVVRCRLVDFSETKRHVPAHEDVDFIEIVRIGIGDPADAESEEGRILDALFWNGGQGEDCEKILREAFKLTSEGDTILTNRGGIHVSMDQELRDPWTEIGREEGRIEERAASHARMVDSYVISVRKGMSERGVSLDYAMSFVPEEMAEEVRSCIESGQNAEGLR